jgi:hypothetical protein
VAHHSKEGVHAMTNLMLGPPGAAAGGAVAGAAGSGVSPHKDSAGVSEEFMALVAGLLAGLVPGTQPPAQTSITAPGPTDGKVLQESDADVAGPALPQGLAEQAAAAADVARAVLAVGPQASGPRSPKGLLHSLSEHGLDLAGLDGKEQALSRSHALDAPKDVPRNGAPVSVVSFTISPVESAQAHEAPAMASPAPVAPAVSEDPIVATAPPVTPAADDGADVEARKAPAAGGPPITPPVAAQDDAAPAATAEAPTARTADDTTEDEVTAPAPAATQTGSTDRTRDVGPARAALPAHSPHQLAHELAGHLRMSIREEGREIQISLRPAELGSLTIRVVMQDGVLQAHIAADRPEAARLLEQSLAHLEDTLADRGYELGGVDVNAGGPDAREAGYRAQDAHDHGHGHGRRDHDHADVVGAATAAVVAHDGDIDLLA